MSQGEMTRIEPKRRMIAWACFLVALYLFGQLLGLLFIDRIAQRSGNPDDPMVVPLSVRFVGFVADKVHERIGVIPDSDGSNWPAGFRIFFIMELCGLAGLSIGLVQLGSGLLKQRSKWIGEARQILAGSCAMLVVGVLSLMLIE